MNIAKNIGDTWMNGSCETCICELKNDIAEPRCTVKECPKLSEHPDYNVYELEEVPSSECCKKYKRVACKHDGAIYEVRKTKILVVLKFLIEKILL